jgi:hypothetical protein
MVFKRNDNKTKLLSILSVVLGFKKRNKNNKPKQGAVSLAGANWTDIEFAGEVNPEHETTA